MADGPGRSGLSPTVREGSSSSSETDRTLPDGRARLVFQKHLYTEHLGSMLPMIKKKRASFNSNYSCGFVDHLVGNQSSIHEATRKNPSLALPKESTT
jgi:hypothetical protein